LDVVGLDVLAFFVGLDVVGFVDGLDVVSFVVGLDILAFFVGLDVVGFVVGLDVVGFVDVGFLNVGDNYSCSLRRFLLLLWPRIVSSSLDEDVREKSEAP
jgi:hypothetical protein